MAEANGIRQLGSGRYQARYRFAPGPRGTRTASFDTRREAKAWQVTQDAATRTGVGIDPRHGRTTTGAYFDAWLARQGHLNVSTADVYRRIWTRQLAPTFARLALADVTAAVVQRWQADELRRLAPATVGNAQTLLSMVLGTAVGDAMLAVNPMARVRRPKRARVVVEVDPAPVAALFDHAPARLSVALHLALGAGLRSGELRGLTVDRVDLERGVLTVDRQLKAFPVGHVFAEGEWHQGRNGFDAPKGGRMRTVPVEAGVLDSIRRHLRLFGAGPAGLVVTGRRGGPMNASLWSREWALLYRASGLEGFGVHQLRHAYVSWSLANGEPIANVSRNVGHTTHSFTLDRYVHPEINAPAASVLGRIARGQRVAALRPAR